MYHFQRKFAVLCFFILLNGLILDANMAILHTKLPGKITWESETAPIDSPPSDKKAEDEPEEKIEPYTSFELSDSVKSHNDDHIENKSSHNGTSDVFNSLPKSLQDSLLNLKTKTDRKKMLKIISKFYEGDGPTLFTVTNTEIGRTWEQVPFREKFQWLNSDAGCHSFSLAVPDERDAHGVITLCVYRRHLIKKELNSMIVHERQKQVDDFYEQRGMTLYGNVVDNPGSSVFGRYVEGYFYGEILLTDPITGHRIIYVVEEIKLLSKLLRNSEKIMHNLLVVMNSGQHAQNKYNAVVSLGVSLQHFMTNAAPVTGLQNLSPVPFVILSTGHTHYITAGEPKIINEDNGGVKIVSPGDTIAVDNDGSVTLNTNTKEYTFRPGGKTILKEGLKITTLQEHEGPVAITAVTSFTDDGYSCIIPSASFTRVEGAYLCKVCLLADQSFEDNYVLTQQTATRDTNEFLGTVIDRSSWIFRSVDWNGDDKEDNIGLDYDSQFTKWKYKDDTSEEITQEKLDVLFGTLQEIDFSDCCLAIAYTMKKFPEDVYAKSAMPQPMAPSGICSPRSDEGSKNVILISANNKGGNYSSMTQEQLVYLTSHEIAKSFGATFDTTGELNCDSIDGKESKHYLLWPDVLRKWTLEEQSFSPCSIQSIKLVMESCKSACFDLDIQPFCGNGIIEEGEECDCGSEYECSSQNCCYARNELKPCMKTGHPCGENNGVDGFSTSILNTITFAIIANLALQLIH